VEGGPYSVEFVASARHQLAKLPRSVQHRVTRAIDNLAGTPRPHGAKLLSGGNEIWRIRVGDYRVLYTVEDDRLVVLVIRVAHRREAYRAME
jgi:mRNA interferase RelE/StbE